MSAPRSLARSTVHNLFGLGVPLLVAVAAMPAVIQGLGAERFGILALAWALLNYFTVFDLGLGRAATKFVAEAVAAGRAREIPAIISSAALLQGALGLLGGLLLVVLAPVLAGRLLHLPAMLVGEAQQSFRILAVALPFLLVTGSLRGALEAAQRFDLSNLLRAPLNAASFLLPLGGVAVGLHLPGILGLLTAASAVGAVAYAVAVSRVFPGALRPRRPDPTEVRRLLAFGGWVMVSSAVSPILVYVDRFVIGSIVGVAGVSYYAAPFEIVSRLLILPSSLAATLFPVFSAAAMSRPAELAPLVSRALKILILTVGFFVVLAQGLGENVLNWWIGPVFAAQGSLALRILAVGVLVNALASVPFSVLHGLGRPDLPARFNLIELPIHLGLCWVLVQRWGITGAAAAWTCRVSLDASLLLWATGRHARFGPGTLRTPDLIRAAALVIAAASACGLVAASAHGWARFSAVAGIMAVASTAAWLWVLNPSDRRRVAGALTW